MNQKSFNPKLYAPPTTQWILGTHIGGRANFMALAWASRMNFQPPLIAIGVNRGHASHEAILSNRQFSLCMPSTAMVAETDYVGMVSGNRTDKSQLFPLFYGELEHAPLIESCPLNLELRLYDRLEMPTNTLFLGEIVGTWCEQEMMTDGVPDIEKIRPFLLTMPDNRYWAFGPQVGKAWHEGKALKKQGSQE